MKTTRFLLTFFVFLFLISCQQGADKHVSKQAKDANGYSYSYVTNDPLGVRVYQLSNGLTVYLSKNTDKPRIQTFIAVRAGSAYDPKETTGLAHYLEHMMFKGTDEIGTTNWEKEKNELEVISDLYEQHKAATDPKVKKKIYAKIDSVSQIAAKYSVPSEYDKMVASIGAEGTNAWTSNEETVYMNNIPSNELDKWISLESERFGQLVLRLFHTELETVYEEFNMGQDNDYRKSYYKLVEGLFPVHPYGQQKTIGKAEHLKNPSMVNIHNYWNTYYVPNNMAICMSGDIDFEKTIKEIDATFGKIKPGNVPERNLPKEEPITKAKEYSVVGPDQEHLRIGYRFNGIKSDDRKYVDIISRMLSNNVAGLIDIDLVQKQKVLEANCGVDFLPDYSTQLFFATPREGQKLEEVKDLIVSEVDKIKKGEFEDWLVKSAVNDMKLEKTLGLEDNWRAYNFVETFINRLNWVDEVDYLNQLDKITKQQIVDFANKNYGENYVAVYKRTGKDTTAVKVEKPQITQVPMNRDTASAFKQKFDTIKPEPLTPVFNDFDKDLAKTELSKGVELDYIKSTVPNLFRLYFMVDMGSANMKELPVAFDLLNYLGTDKYSPEQLKEEFYKYGIRINSWSTDNSAVFELYGLENSFDKSVELLEHVITSVKPDTAVYRDFVKGVLKKRADAKLDKWNILWNGMLNYGKFGAVNPFTNIVTSKDLQGGNPETYTNILKSLCNYPHRFVYCGNREKSEVEAIIKSKLKMPENLLEYPAAVQLQEQDYKKPLVFVVDYDMVQVMMVTVAKDVKFSPDLLPPSELFNEYFGSGLSSIVFQEIREAKGLAYSAFASYSSPRNPDYSYYLYTFIGTQSDKLKEADDAMSELLNTMPKADIQFSAAKDAIKKKIESERNVNMDIFWNYKWHLDRNLTTDSHKEIYEKVQQMNMSDLEQFFNNHIKDKNFALLILGNKNTLDMKTLKKIGDVKELTLEQIFNY
jgi:zinc protease